MEPKLIAIEYIKTWFFLDLLSSIPVDYIFLILDSGILDTKEVKRYTTTTTTNLKILQTFEMLKIFKMIKSLTSLYAIVLDLGNDTWT